MVGTREDLGGRSWAWFRSGSWQTGSLSLAPTETRTTGCVTLQPYPLALKPGRVQGTPILRVQPQTPNMVPEQTQPQHRPCPTSASGQS